jgi:4-hydroxy-3-polyprenylbenzoate decarboxylase
LKLRDYRYDKIPVTLNIGTPPAVMAIAGAGMLHTIIPFGCDELGIAGGLQGYPVEICKAKTIDAYAVANSEWVLEGYLLPERVWETEEAAKVGKEKRVPFFPEWTGYMGRAWKAPKFQVTAITHRTDRPIFFSPLAHSFEGEILTIPFREACFYELAHRLYHGLVVDVNVLDGLKSLSGVVFQIRKSGHIDEGFQRQILLGALANSPGLRMAIAVDEDVDIYNAEEVMWALCTRVDWEKNIFRLSPGGSQEKFGDELVQPGSGPGIVIDATVPVDFRANFQRPHHPVENIDLKKWFTQAEIDAAITIQSEYGRLLAKKGW